LPPDEWTRGAEIHRIRDFGEDLYRKFRVSGLAEIDLAEVDRATERIVVTDIKKRSYHSVEQIVRKLLTPHHFDASACERGLAAQTFLLTHLAPLVASARLAARCFNKS